MRGPLAHHPLGGGGVGADLQTLVGDGRAPDQAGRDPDPAVGDGVDRGGHLHGVDRQRLAERDAVLRHRRPDARVGEDALGLTGDAHVGLLAEAELGEVLAQLTGLEVAARQHRADVGGLRDDAGQGHVEGVVAEPVVDDPVAADQAGRHDDARLVGGLARVDEGTEGEHLLDRAGLVHVGHGAGDQVALGLRGPRVAGVVRRVVGEGEHLAGLGVEDHREGRVGPGVLARLAQHALDVPLEVEVDGGVEVLAVDGRLDGGLAERDPVADADGVALRAVVPGQQAVEVPLEAGQGLVGAHEADQVGRHVAGRVVADRVVPGVQAVEAGLLGGGDHGLGLAGRHAAGDVGELLVLQPQGLEGLEVVDVEPSGQELRELGRLVPGQLRVGHHHRPVDRVGERLAVAVQDVAALGGQLDDVGALGGRHRGVRVGVHALQLHQPGTEHRQHHRDDHEPEPQPQVR